MENERYGSSPPSIGYVGSVEEDDERKEEGGCAESLCGDSVVAHFGHDFREEDGEGGVGHVGEKEHDCCNPSFGVYEDR